MAPCPESPSRSEECLKWLANCKYKRLSNAHRLSRLVWKQRDRNQKVVINQFRQSGAEATVT